MKIDRIDHLVLTVMDIKRTCAFYQSVLGFQVVTFGDGRKALQSGAHKLNLHELGKDLFGPKAAVPMPGAIDICFITDVPIDEVLRELREKGVAVEEGPVEREGAAGALLSVYLRDPDWNLIEISNYIIE
ncbi:VOC family protein [Terracidiphilus gabretensis]|uniref:VOC family protein n=1 Tax=Terracidiphilus gabretensis TaxID=1577687 RepID=UPI00071BFD6F|nr:VOC family protein [Terracidiphilus gabretensis]